MEKFFLTVIRSPWRVLLILIAICIIYVVFITPIESASCKGSTACGLFGLVIMFGCGALYVLYMISWVIWKYTTGGVLPSDTISEIPNTENTIEKAKVQGIKKENRKKLRLYIWLSVIYVVLSIIIYSYIKTDTTEALFSIPMPLYIVIRFLFPFLSDDYTSWEIGGVFLEIVWFVAIIHAICQIFIGRWREKMISCVVLALLTLIWFGSVNVANDRAYLAENYAEIQKGKVLDEEHAQCIAREEAKYTQEEITADLSISSRIVEACNYVWK